jgi:hypothetical protein
VVTASRRLVLPWWPRPLTGGTLKTSPGPLPASRLWARLRPPPRPLGRRRVLAEADGVGSCSQADCSTTTLP